MKERIFITGGLGYIGTVFAQQALLKGYDVCLYDSLIYEQDQFRLLSEIEKFNIKNSQLKLIIGDTRNIDFLRSSIVNFEPTYIMHWAELSSVYACNHHPSFTHNVNYIASKDVINLAEELNIKIFYNSTSSVYGTQNDSREKNEEDKLPEPTDLYCKYKLKMESFIKLKVSQNPKFKIIVFRPATVFGVSPRFRIELLPNHFTYMAISKRNIPLSGLNAYRAAIDIDDLVDAYFKVIEKGSWESLIYNIGNLNLNKKEFALGIKDLIDCRISEIPDIGDLRNLQIDCTKFNSEFKFSPKFSYNQSISKINDYLKINLDNIEANNFNELLNMPLDRWRQICSNL